MLEEMNQPVGTPPPTVESPEIPSNAGNTVSHIIGNSVSQKTDLPTDRQGDRETDRTTDRQPDQLTDPQTDYQTGLPPDRPTARTTGKTRISKAILEKVRAFAKGKRAQVTLKLPIDMDEYITRHVRENWEQKLLKQDIITRGIQLAILEIETGEKLADLD